MIYKSHLVSDMRGSVGGITYSKTRYGLTGRARITPVNPLSNIQELMRTRFNAAVAGWKALTVPQRTAWDTFASGTPWKNKLGQDVFLTGQAMYIGQRTAHFAADPTFDESDLDDCGCTPGLLPTPLLEFGCCTNPTIGTILTVTNQDSTLAMDFIVRISPAQNFSRTYWNGPYRYEQQILLAAVAAGASDDAEFCPLCIGRYFFEVRGFDSVNANNMSTKIRGFHDVCTDPI